MAHTNQEQLLNEVFRDIRAADDRLSAAGLEPQVMAAWVRRMPADEVRLKPDTTYRRYGFAVAAGILAIVASSVTGSRSPALPSVRPPALPVAAANVAIPVPEETGTVRREPDTTLADTKSADTTSAAEMTSETPLMFVPLMPLTPRELSGSFQIVRVQMPRESLGAMASPLEYPNPFVEADVLLGEDGMARAIRVSTGQSAISWRSR